MARITRFCIIRYLSAALWFVLAVALFRGPKC